MDENEKKMLCWEEIKQIVGCAFEVANELGGGLQEKPYENALCVEFKLRGIPYEQQPRFNIQYKGVLVGVYVPDLVAYSKIIIDTKSIDHITDVERAQVLNYLRITGLRVGLILNFKHSKLEWRRVVL